MGVHPPTKWQRHRVGSVAAVANLVPLVGVLTLEWDVYSLLVLYWVEGLVTVLLAAAKALFAERGSRGLPDIEPLHELREKRGGWRPVSRMPEIYPRNVPFAASILGFWTVAVLPASVLYWVTAVPVIRPSLSLLVGGVGLVITQLHEFLSDYLVGKEYAKVSAQEILREPLQLGLVTLTLGLLASAGDRSGGLVLLTGIVVVKTTSSVYRIVTDHTDLPVPSVLYGAFDGSHAEPRPDIDTPDGPVRGRVSVDTAPVLLGSLPMVAFGFAHRSTFAILIGLAFAALTGGSVWLVLGLVFILVVAGARVGSYYLRYGTIEYRRYEGQLVAYDRALGAALVIILALIGGPASLVYLLLAVEYGSEREVQKLAPSLGWSRFRYIPVSLLGGGLLLLSVAIQPGLLLVFLIGLVVCKMAVDLRYTVGRIEPETASLRQVRGAAAAEYTDDMGLDTSDRQVRTFDLSPLRCVYQRRIGNYTVFTSRYQSRGRWGRPLVLVVPNDTATEAKMPLNTLIRTTDWAPDGGLDRAVRIVLGGLGVLFLGTTGVFATVGTDALPVVAYAAATLGLLGVIMLFLAIRG